MATGERKIENDAKKADEQPELKGQRYEVIVGFAPFDKGDIFTGDPDHDWQPMVDQGYLREIDGDEPGREVPDGERSHVRPR